MAVKKRASKQWFLSLQNSGRLYEILRFRVFFGVLTICYDCEIECNGALEKSSKPVLRSIALYS